ncbi:hypothetical protein RZS08_47295, partial [Arthrospira platensis SPKY1]|nr:hypothetical protein [Arthrospira platensis SPKY1]
MQILRRDHGTPGRGQAHGGLPGAPLPFAGGGVHRRIETPHRHHDDEEHGQHQPQQERPEFPSRGDVA